MNRPIPEWAERIIHDLQGISGKLLDTGLSQGSAWVGNSRFRAASCVVPERVKRFNILLPGLLSSLRDELGLNDPHYGSGKTPAYGIPSRRVCDYEVYQSRLVPVRWLIMLPNAQASLPAIRWLLGMLERLADDLYAEKTRLDKLLEEARRVRRGESEHARHDLQFLDGLRDVLHEAEKKLATMRHTLQREAGVRITPAFTPPSPFPAASAWMSFRQDVLIDPVNRHRLSNCVRQLLCNPNPVADLPSLFQRWVGLQIIRSAERLSWQVEGDEIGSLFLGGHLLFRRGGSMVDLWLDARLSAVNAGMIGWRSDRKGQELTPDFLFCVGPRGARDAFVLDATLSTDDESLKTKGRYRHLLTGEDIRLIAGVPVARCPLRSWAVAPIQSRHCRLLEPSGQIGVIPLDLRDEIFPALDAWLADVFEHADRLTYKQSTLQNPA